MRAAFIFIGESWPPQVIGKKGPPVAGITYYAFALEVLLLWQRCGRRTATKLALRGTSIRFLCRYTEIPNGEDDLPQRVRIDTLPDVFTRTLRNYGGRSDEDSALQPAYQGMQFLATITL